MPLPGITASQTGARSTLKQKENPQNTKTSMKFEMCGKARLINPTPLEAAHIAAWMSHARRLFVRTTWMTNSG